jgi:hypothetical protein
MSLRRYLGSGAYPSRSPALTDTRTASLILDETVDAKPTATFDARWRTFLTTPAAFTGLVYMGV